MSADGEPPRARRSAADLRRQVLGPLDPAGVRIMDAVIEGRLDLTAADIAAPLVFERCEFEAAPVFEGADLHSLAFVGCTLPGLLANGVRVRRDIDLSGSTLTGAHRTNVSVTHTAAVWICESVVGGRLLCIGTTIDGQGDRALHADRIQIGGSARFMAGFEARGELRLLGAQVSGSVEFYGVQVSNPDGPAIGLADADIRGALHVMSGEGRRSRIDGRIVLASSRIKGACRLRELEISAGPGGGLGEVDNQFGSIGGESRRDVAVDASRLVVDGNLLIGPGTVVRGDFALPGAELGGLVVAATARLTTPGGRALDLTNSDIRSHCRFERGLEVRGRIRLPRAHVRGRLLMSGVTLAEPEDGVLLDAYGLLADGDVDLSGLAAEDGALVLVSLSSRNLHLTGGKLTDVRLDGAAVDGRLDLRWDRCDQVSLDGATTSTLLLVTGDQPTRYRIAGLTYERIGTGDDLGYGPWLPDWLDRADFDAGAYEQAARVLRQHGYGAQAEAVLIRGRDAASRLGFRTDWQGGTTRQRLIAPPRRAFDWLYGRAVGYGFRPARSLIALVVLLLVVLGLLSAPALTRTLRATDAQGVVYTVSGSHHDCADGHVRCFHRVYYAIDTVVPLVSLNQRSTWYPDARTAHGEFLDVFLDVATLLGWLLSSIVVLSFARLARTI